ncbi:hypothetical protein RND81_04G072500 [Saponaria officinalis]|uniref:Uncharacterized protein n=1 Tax=Saponaria officinalis TaxID=3572 RepID=A0AAW1LIV1_SAPOF
MWFPCSNVFIKLVSAVFMWVICGCCSFYISFSIIISWSSKTMSSEYGFSCWFAGTSQTRVSLVIIWYLFLDNVSCTIVVRFEFIFVVGTLPKFLFIFLLFTELCTSFYFCLSLLACFGSRSKLFIVCWCVLDSL